MRLLVIGVFVLFVALAWEFVIAQPPQVAQPEATSKHSVLMRRKLEHAQGMLEGLSTKDFELIQKHAKLMNAFTTLEKWTRADSPRYRAQLNIFWTANNEMLRHAKDKNLDGATLAYTQMTVSCVSCHKYLRDPVE